MHAQVEELIRLALAEDIGEGDVTSEYFVPEDLMSCALILTKTTGVVAGIDVAEEVFKRVDPDVRVSVLLENGSRVTGRAAILKIQGRARSLLTAERVALNFLQRLSGVATMTRRFVDEIVDTGAQILDTRKTTPGWRLLEKQAVVAGGGVNHRMGLYDRAMVKDNHLVAEGNTEALAQAIARLKADKPGVEVEVEADNLGQVEAFLSIEGVDYILLDNMSLSEMKEAVAMRSGSRPYLEASGGVRLETVRAIAKTGVDFVSVGALTHSAPSLDISMEFIEND